MLQTYAITPTVQSHTSNRKVVEYNRSLQILVYQQLEE